MNCLSPSLRSRACFLLAIFALLMVTCEITAATDEPQVNRKNVLFIAVDDLRPELGCYGAEHAQSPNIDALAKRSLTFRNHFVQVPTCGASRYALLTGRSPLFSGAFKNQSLYEGSTELSSVELPGAQTFPEMFRRSGYQTVCIGKISHTPDGRVYGHRGNGDGRMEVPYGWSELATPMGSWKRGWGIFYAYANGKNREDGDLKDLMQFEVEEDDELPDGLMATAAIEKLKQLKQSGKPFFLGLGFFKPHLPFVAPRQDWEAFDGLDLPLPPHRDKSSSAYTNHRSDEFFKYDFPYDKTRPLDDEKITTNRRAYLACVRYTDRQIGRVLESLKDQGLSDSTVVVLWSDHGWNLGDSQQWGKHTLLDRAVKSPLMISVPGMSTAGQYSDSLVESIDLFPTLVDICNPSHAKAEKRLDGKSLLPILSDPMASVREASFSYWKGSVSVRSKSFRLIAKFNGAKKPENLELEKIELYSAGQQFDPIKNLAAEYPDVVELLTAKFQVESAR